MGEQLMYHSEKTPLFPAEFKDEKSRIVGVKGRMQAAILFDLNLSVEEKFAWLQNNAALFSKLYEDRIKVVDFHAKPEVIEPQLQSIKHAIAELLMPKN